MPEKRCFTDGNNFDCVCFCPFFFFFVFFLYIITWERLGGSRSNFQTRSVGWIARRLSKMGIIGPCISWLSAKNILFSLKQALINTLNYISLYPQALMIFINCILVCMNEHFPDQLIAVYACHSFLASLSQGPGRLIAVTIQA